LLWGWVDEIKPITVFPPSEVERFHKISGAFWMKSIEYKNRQIRIQKIIQELEKILDDLVFEIINNKTRREKMERKNRRKKFLN